MTKKVGFLETQLPDGSISRSNTRLTVFISAVICIMAASTEVWTQISTLDNGDKVVKADWMAIAALCGVLLVGNGVTKVAQNYKKPTNTNRNEGTSTT